MIRFNLGYYQGVQIRYKSIQIILNVDPPGY